MSATLFNLFSATGAVLSTQGSFYNESATVSAPDSEDRRQCLTPLSLVSVVLSSARLLSRNRQKAYAGP